MPCDESGRVKRCSLRRRPCSCAASPARGGGEVVGAGGRVGAGETLLSPEEAVQLLRFASSRREHEYESRQAIAQLTPREREALQAPGGGLARPEIAKRLGISIPT